MGDIDVKAIRKKLGLTQEQFSKTFFIPMHLIRDWENKVLRPKGDYMVYLILIDRIPEQVIEAAEEVRVWRASIKSKPIDFTKPPKPTLVLKEPEPE
jgi:transcriptional regulator with XRE-family HTH domain